MPLHPHNFISVISSKYIQLHKYYNMGDKRSVPDSLFKSVIKTLRPKGFEPLINSYEVFLG